MSKVSRRVDSTCTQIRQKRMRSSRTFHSSLQWPSTRLVGARALFESQSSILDLVLVKPVFDLCDQVDNSQAQVLSASYANGKVSLELAYCDASGAMHQESGILDMVTGHFQEGIPGGNDYDSIAAFFAAKIPQDSFAPQLSAFLSQRYGSNYGMPDTKGVNFRFIADTNLPSGTKRYGFSLPIDFLQMGGNMVVNDYIPLICDVAADGSVTVYMAQNLVSSDIGSEIGTANTITDLFDRLSQCFDINELQHPVGSHCVGFVINSWDIHPNDGIIDFNLGFQTGNEFSTSVSIPGHLILSDIIAGTGGLSFDNDKITWTRLETMYHEVEGSIAEIESLPSSRDFHVGSINLNDDQFSFQVYRRNDRIQISDEWIQVKYAVEMSIDDPLCCVSVTSSTGIVHEYASFSMWLQDYYSEVYNPTSGEGHFAPYILPGSFDSWFDAIDETYRFRCTTDVACDGGGTLIEGHQDAVTKIVTIDTINGVAVSQECGSLLAYIECLHGASRPGFTPGQYPWVIDPSSGYDAETGYYRLILSEQYIVHGSTYNNQYVVYIDLATGLVWNSPHRGWSFSIQSALR